jgi:hypothetical protein
VASISFGEGRVEVSGDVVQRDALTLTVASGDGEETRYPRIRARLVGRVVADDADWLRLDLDDGKPNVLVPWVAIERLEVSRRTPRQWGERGAALGAVMPGVPLGLVGAAVFSMGNLDCVSHFDSSLPFIGAALGVGAGAVIGGLVGTALSDDGWDKVSVSVGIAPRPGKGVAGALCLRFCGPGERLVVRAFGAV